MSNPAIDATSKPYFVHESSYVDEPSQIGDGTAIWHFCHILGHSQIGQHCKIGQNVVIGPRVTLEDDVFCGPSMVFTNVFNPRSAIVRNSDEHFKKTLVKQGASIGANATIVCGVTIGRYAFVGAGSVVTRNVPDYALVYGNPARQQGWACFCGESLKAKESKQKEISIQCTSCARQYQQHEQGLREIIQ